MGIFYRAVNPAQFSFIECKEKLISNGTETSKNLAIDCDFDFKSSPSKISFYEYLFFVSKDTNEEKQFNSQTLGARELFDGKEFTLYNFPKNVGEGKHTIRYEIPGSYLNENYPNEVYYLLKSEIIDLKEYGETFLNISYQTKNSYSAINFK